MNARKKDAKATTKTPLLGAWWITLPLLVGILMVFTAADNEARKVPCRAIDITVDQLDGMYFVDAPSLRNAIVQQGSELIINPVGGTRLEARHSRRVLGCQPGQNGQGMCAKCGNSQGIGLQTRASSGI